MFFDLTMVSSCLLNSTFRFSFQVFALIFALEGHSLSFLGFEREDEGHGQAETLSTSY